MKSLLRHRFRPQLEGLEERCTPSTLDSTVTLPISAFLTEQGHHSIFAPPVRDQSAWSNSVFDPGATPSDPTRLLLVDYTGQAAQYLLQNGINLNTKVTGFVTETPIGHTGQMEVSLNLQATNALTWIVNVQGINANEPGASNNAPLELGYRAQDLVGHPELKPALSSVSFHLTWQEQNGANLPDLAELNENYALYAPPGFSFERFDIQSWGIGTLRAGTTQGSPGQLAIASTCQVGDLTNGALPGTLGDGFWQEPVDIIPIASDSTHVAYLNGTLFVMDTSNANDHVLVVPAAGGGATVTSNLGSGTFGPVTRLAVCLGSGNNDVAIASPSGATVDVVALNGNNNVAVGNAGKLVIHLGGGNNCILTGNTSAGAQFICIGGNGNNNVYAANSTAAEILVAGNGNNHIRASGTDDFIEVLGNGNNHIADDGSMNLIWLADNGNNWIDNDGVGSFTDILSGHGHNHIDGPH